MKNEKLFLVNGDESLVIDSKKDSNTQFGIFKAKNLQGKKPGSKIKTHKGDLFYVVDPSAPDLIKKVIRLPQIITLKDLGSLIVYLGIKNNSKVLDVGSGSGIAACVVAALSEKIKVFSYEIRKDFIKVAKKNADLFSVNNIKFINTDIKDGIKEKNFDCGIVDLPDPWNVIPMLFNNFKVGARIAAYSPSIIQIEKTIKSLPKEFKVERLVQNTETNWKVELDRDILRPESNGMLHTGFLLFIRKTSLGSSA